MDIVRVVREPNRRHAGDLKPMPKLCASEQVLAPRVDLTIYSAPVTPNLRETRRPSDGASLSTLCTALQHTSKPKLDILLRGAEHSRVGYWPAANSTSEINMYEFDP